MRRHREKPNIRTSDHCLVDPLNSSWGSYEINRVDLAGALTGESLPEEKTLDEYSKYAYKFIKELSKSDPGSIIIPEFYEDANKVMPEKSSVLDHLLAISRAPGTWKLPTYKTLKALASERQPTEDVISKIETRIHTFSQDSDAQIREISNWIMKKFQATEEERPIGVVAMALITMQCSQEDYNQVTSPSSRGEVVKFKTHEHPESKETPNRIPIKFILGDGISWCAVFQYSVHKISTGYHKMLNSGVPQEFLQLLDKIPAFTGHYIKSDVLDIEDWVKTTSDDPNFRFKPFVDVQSIATLAGYNCVQTDTTILPYLAAGILTFRFFDWHEDFWRHDWATIPFQVRWDVLSQLRSYTYGYLTFLYALLYEILPDPEVVAHLTRKTTLELADWWSTYVASTLNATTPPAQDGRTSKQSRQELINTLTKNTTQGERAGEAPYRVRHFSCLLGSWPPLTKGGARYLHPVREHFLAQYQVFAALPIDGFEHMFSRQLNPFMADYARFGLSQGDIINLDKNSPVPSRTTSLHLECHPSIKPRTAKLLLPDISLESMQDEAARTGRPVRDLILEWVRLNVNRIKHLFDIVQSSPDLADLIYPHYEKIRCMHMNLGACNPTEIDFLNQRLTFSRERESAEIREKLAKVNDTLADLNEAKINLELAVDLLDSDRIRGLRSDRTEYRDYSMAVPSLRHIRKKRFKPTRPQQIVPPLYRRLSSRRTSIPVPDLPFGEPSWTEGAELAPQVPDSALASSRARGRSIVRSDLYTFKRSTPSSVRHRSRSTSRKRGRYNSRQKSRSKSRSRAGNQRSNQQLPPSKFTPERTETGNQSPDTSFPRSPSICIDYPSPRQDPQDEDVQTVAESMAQASVKDNIDRMSE